MVSAGEHSELIERYLATEVATGQIIGPVNPTIMGERCRSVVLVLF